MTTKTDTATAPLAFAPAPQEIVVANRLGITEAEVNKGTKVYDEATRNELLWFFALATTKGFSLREAASAVKTDHTVLKRAWRGVYHNQKGDLIDPKQLITGIRLLRENEDIRAGRMSVAFVKTKMTELIFDMGDAVRRDKAMTIIYGPSHIGKTTALQEYARCRQGVFYLRAPAGTNLRGFVKAVAEAIGIQPDGYSHDALKTAIARRLNDTNQLIVDEAHDILISYRREQRIITLEWLRSLYNDGRGPSLVICSSPILPEAMERGPDARLLEQFATRTLAPLNLCNAPSADDIDAIISAYGFPEPKGEDKKLAHGIAKTQRLRALTIRLSRALSYAADDKKAVTWQHFRDADGIFHECKTGRVYGDAA